jgi:polyhydroxyalkanoate synthase
MMLRNMAERRTVGRGPHPLPLFLSMAARACGDDRARLAAVLEGVRRYQQAPKPAPMPTMEPVAARGGARLLAVGGPADAPALVVVPSLINAPAVLDLAPGRSLIRHLAADGHRVFLVDWGPMRAGERRLGLAGLVSVRLMPLLAALPGPIRLAGYCLGGTLALAAGQLLGRRLARLALIAAPWHFDGFPDRARRDALETWRAVQPVGKTLGAVPVSLLNPLFWSLDERAVLAKFEALARRPEGDPQLGWFAAVEDWANSGAPLTLPAARDLFLHGFGADRIGRGLWRVGGQLISPARIEAPILDAGAMRDRIVPPSARLRRPDVARLAVAAGHVGMVVGSGAMQSLWEPLSNWLRQG